MPLKDLTLVVVAKNAEDMRRFPQEYVSPGEAILVINIDQVPLSVIGNHYLDVARGSIFGMVHADVLFGEDALETLCKTAEGGAVCGVVGNNPLYQYPESYIHANKNPNVVSTLDSASVFFRRDLGLRFDSKTFDGFHLHVEDLCLQAGQRGIASVVPAADCFHNAADVNGKQWHDDWRVYYRKLRVKWPHVLFGTT
jgi:hypothetical protein